MDFAYLPVSTQFGVDGEIVDYVRFNIYRTHGDYTRRPCDGLEIGTGLLLMQEPRAVGDI